MSEQIKEFYNDAVGSAITQTVVSNDASTKAFIKNVWVTGGDYPTDFDLVVGDNVIYKSVALGAGETVKFENENLTIPKSGTMKFVNNALVYGAMFEKIFSIQTYTTLTTGKRTCISDGGDIITLSSNQGNSYRATHAVVDKGGNTVKEPTQMASYDNNYGTLEIVYKPGGTYAGVWLKGSNGYLSYGYMTMTTYVFNYRDALISNTTWSDPTIAPCGEGFMIAYYDSSTQDMAVCFFGSSMDLLTNKRNFNPDILSVKLNSEVLSNGNTALIWTEGPGPYSSQLAIFGYNNVTPVVAKTEYTAHRAYYNKIKALSNGTFAIVYRDATTGGADIGKFFGIILNNDGTVNKAAFELASVEDAWGAEFYLEGRPGDELVLFYYQNSKWKARVYDSELVLLEDVGIIADGPLTYPNFYIQPTTGQAALQYGGTGWTIKRLLNNAPFNIKVDGVEVISD